MVNEEKGHQGKKPVLALTVIIHISSNGGTTAAVTAAAKE